MTPGFFTRPYYKVPHPRMDVRWIAAVHLALVKAFDLIRADGFDLASADEDGITYSLEQTLENRLLPTASEDLDLSFIRSVTRESASANHDESSIGRKPDLVFRLNRRELCASHDRLQDCLFAECKPVGRKHPLQDHYCAVEKKTSGIERFVTGAYAAAMEQAIMIAYVRDGFQINPDLLKALKVPRTWEGLGEPSDLECTVDSDGLYSQGLYLTKHQRLFRWKNGLNATPIEIYHSWHDC